MPSSDKQLAFSVKTSSSSREVPNKGTDVSRSMSQGTKDKGPAEDAVKAVGTKRPHPDAPSRVYVRRRVENEHGKVQSSQEVKDKAKEQEEERNVESGHSKVRELKGNGTKEHKEQPNVESAHSKVNSSQEQLKGGSGRDKNKAQHAQVDKPPPVAKSGMKELGEQQTVKHDDVNSPQVPPPPFAESGTKEKDERQAVQHDDEVKNKPEVAALVAESGTKEEEERRTVQHDDEVKNKLEAAPLVAESGTKEMEGQHDVVKSKPEAAPLIADSGAKREEEGQTMQHDEVAESGTKEEGHNNQVKNKPEVAPPVAESGTEDEEERQAGQHDEVNNQPEAAPPAAKEEEEERRTVQHDEVENKPQVPPLIAESGTEEQEQHIQVNNKPEAAPPVAAGSGGLVPSAKASSPVAESLGPVPSESREKANQEAVPERNKPPVASASVPPVSPGTSAVQRATSNQNPYWSERYDRLQTYLHNCDRSSQEGYMRMLRSLTAAGRSAHAIELEKRAIHLLVEEGKELQRMKALNVLGKSPPNGSAKQATPLQR